MDYSRSNTASNKSSVGNDDDCHVVSNYDSEHDGPGSPLERHQKMTQRAKKLKGDSEEEEFNLIKKTGFALF